MGADLAVALVSAVAEVRVSLSRNSPSLVHSSWVMILSPMAWSMPLFQPYSRVWLTVVAVAIGRAAYLSHGEPEGLLVEAVGACGLGGEFDHPIPAGGIDPAARRVVPGEDPGLVAAVAAGADG